MAGQELGSSAMRSRGRIRPRGSAFAPRRVECYAKTDSDARVTMGERAGTTSQTMRGGSHAE